MFEVRVLVVDQIDTNLGLIYNRLKEYNKAVDSWNSMVPVSKLLLNEGSLTSALIVSKSTLKCYER
jgi:hypothetical protein